MKIALAQINPVIGAFEENAKKIVSYANMAKSAGCDLAVFSELALCGYPPKDLLERPAFLADCQATLASLVKEIQGIGVVVGAALAEKKTGLLQNAAVLFCDGDILQTTAKRLLPTYDVFDEVRYFAPGSQSRAVEFKGVRLGLTVCEDAWNDEDIFKPPRYNADPVAELAADGAGLLINISASPFHRGKRRFRTGLMSHLAKKHGMSAVYVNQVGGNDHLLFDGASTAHGPDGRLLARAADFQEDLVVFDLAAQTGDRHPSSETEVEAVYKALVMGTGDYIRKCGFSSAVVGLSGGVDSALTLAIAARALGPKNVLAIFMPSDFTSDQNFIDTKALAQNLGTPYKIVPIKHLFTGFIDAMPDVCTTGRPSVVEQNIQARVRGVILMAHSNRRGCMVLSTGNKSELAAGYSTLYGDMCGGLAVISDLPKGLVYETCRFINQGKEVIPVSILDKPPSAELAPDQKDEDDLPPYDELDAILEAYIERLEEPGQIIAAGHNPAVVHDVIRRVMNNEYKRRQAPPGLKLTPRAFGEGRRYPMAHGWR